MSNLGSDGVVRGREGAEEVRRAPAEARGGSSRRREEQGGEAAGSRGGAEVGGGRFPRNRCTAGLRGSARFPRWHRTAAAAAASAPRCRSVPAAGLG